MNAQQAVSVQLSAEVDNTEPLLVKAQRKQIEDASEEEFLAAWEWDRMLGCLGEECDRFNVDPFTQALHPAPTLHLEHMRPLCSRLTYLRGTTRHVMHLTYSVPLQCCAFEMHGQNVVYKQCLIVRDGKAHFQVYMAGEAEKHRTEPREVVANRIVRIFLTEAQTTYLPMAS